MEIVDELMTPGCPNCFVKHMSAALARMVAFRIPKVTVDVRYAERVALARALVNLVEAYTGYESHFDYAVGLMVVAEESAVMNDDFETVEASRKIRTKLVTDGKSTIPEAVREIGELLSPHYLIVGHILEAIRELESARDIDVVIGEINEFTVEDIRRMIDEVNEEYFRISKGDTKEGEEVK